jgi:glycosyltransferase involved in cell wall biosynthesis
VEWDVPLLDGYRYLTLRHLTRRPDVGRFSGLLNPSVVDVLRRERFDVLAVHGWAHATHWLAFGCAFAFGIRLLLRGESNGLGEPTGPKRLMKRAVLGSLFRRARGVLAIGKLNEQFYRSYGVPIEKIFRSPYAVDNAFFRRASERLRREYRRLRQEEGIPEEAHVFLFVGKLVPSKRPLDLIRACRHISERRAVFLLFVGNGPLRDVVERQVSELRTSGGRVVGFRNQTELPRFYAMADTLVLPSTFEPWGLVVNEAMNFGLPVIVSDRVGAGADLVIPDQTGWVFRAGDPLALAYAMERRLESVAESELRSAVVERIRSWGLEQAATGISMAVARVCEG